VISDLTSDMIGLAKGGKIDLALSVGTRDMYVAAILDFRNALQGRLDTINALEGLGDPGGLGSAIATKANLQRSGNAFKYAIAEYLDYLDSFADTVIMSADRLIEAG
jgi:hypothetical protein